MYVMLYTQYRRCGGSRLNAITHNVCLDGSHWKVTCLKGEKFLVINRIPGVNMPIYFTTFRVEYICRSSRE